MSVVNQLTWSDRKAQVLRVLADASFWRWSARFALALIFLNSTLCFSAIWPTVYVLPKLGIAPAFLCLVMVLAAWIRSQLATMDLSSACVARCANSGSG